MRDYIYQNKRNPHKFIRVRRYRCGHYAWKQFIENPVTGVITYTGCSLKRSKKGIWHRVSMMTMLEVLEDYEYVMEGADYDFG